MHELEPSELPTPRWSAADLAVFAFFFLATVVFFPMLALMVMSLFRPGMKPSDLTAIDQVVLTGLMDMILVAFIMFLVKVVRGRSFKETIHWQRHPISTG